MDTPKAIVRSQKERAVIDEEMGMFWRDEELSWWWHRAPIETQAVMIEAFDEVMNDQKSVEDCKVWLLKQKQTQDWKTTKATSNRRNKGRKKERKNERKRIRTSKR